MTGRAESSRRLDQATARFAQVAFADFLGVTISEVAPDRAVLTMPYRAEHLNAGGVLNGGASASLLTMAGTLDVHFVSSAPVGAGLVPAQPQATIRVAPTLQRAGDF
jgi:acyl-coenzyme A thioesterase PaaI-like protein